MGRTIGVIGPPELVSKVLMAALEFPQHNFMDLHYDHEEDTLEIFKANQDKMDVCLFTGPWPYRRVKRELKDGHLYMPMVHISNIGSAIHKIIAQMLIDGVCVHNLSFDCVAPMEASEILAEIGLSSDGMYFMPHNGSVERRRYVMYHESLWKSGKTTGCITGLRGAYLKLKQRGVPAYWSEPSLGTIREAVVKAVLEAETLETSSYQLVVGLAQIVDPDHNNEDILSVSQHTKATMFKVLLEFGEAHGISVVPLEYNYFGLFMTRGTLKDITDDYSKLPQMADISTECKGQIVFGFGVGATAALCYANAVLALKYALEASGGGYIVFGDGRVIGPLGDDTRLEFSRTMTNSQIVAQADKSGLSVATLTRVQSVLSKQGSQIITPEQLAIGLAVTKRNARRILSQLLDAGLANVVGLDQPGTRGRPQRVFEVNLGGYEHVDAEKAK